MIKRVSNIGDKCLFDLKSGVDTKGNYFMSRDQIKQHTCEELAKACSKCCYDYCQTKSKIFNLLRVNDCNKKYNKH